MEKNKKFPNSALEKAQDVIKNLEGKMQYKQDGDTFIINVEQHESTEDLNSIFVRSEILSMDSFLV